MKKLKGVCIGAGYFSQFHFEAWQRIETVEIVAICDLNITKAEEACRQFGISKFYTDYEEMFVSEHPDFVDVITAPQTHVEIIEKAATMGVHVICQKPLAPTLQESLQLADIVRDSDIRFMVHENFRFQPWHRELKKLISERTIGERLFSVNVRMRMGDGWQNDAYLSRQPYFREMERLLIYETGIHFIDVYRYLLGEIDSVYAKLKTLNKAIKGEDFAWVHFDFNSGALGLFDGNRYNESTAENPRLTFGAMLIEGEKGSLRLYEDGRITIQKLGGVEEVHDYAFEDINFAGDCVFRTQLHFVRNLLSGDSFETSVEDYLKNISVQEAIYESAKSGNPVQVKAYSS